MEAEPPELGWEDEDSAGGTAGPDVENFSDTVKNGDVYYRQDSVTVNQGIAGKTAEQLVAGEIHLIEHGFETVGASSDIASSLTMDHIGLLDFHTAVISSCLFTLHV